MYKEHNKSKKKQAPQNTLSRLQLTQTVVQDYQHSEVLSKNCILLHCNISPNATVPVKSLTNLTSEPVM